MDYVDIGRNSIHCGDSQTILKKLEDITFHLLFKDKEVQVQSSSYWKEIMNVVNVSETNADRRLNLVFLSESKVPVHSQYFNTTIRTGQDVYCNSDRDKLVLFPLDRNENALFMVLFNFGDHHVYDCPLINH